MRGRIQRSATKGGDHAHNAPRLVIHEWAGAYLIAAPSGLSE